MTAARRRLLEALADPKVNADLAWLNQTGLVMYGIDPHGLTIKVTPKGLVWLNGAQVFHPSTRPTA